MARAARAQSERLDVRIRPDILERITLAANLQQVAVSAFVRAAAEDQADKVIAEHERVTRVPASYFDELLAALDQPEEPNERLVHAAKRARTIVQRT